MPDTMLVDDSMPLLTHLRTWASQTGHTEVEFFSSLGEARSAARRRSYKRVIADQQFEGEEGDGLGLLEEIRESESRGETETDLVLLTGKPVSERKRRRLERIGGRLVQKGGVDARLLHELFRPEGKLERNVEVGVEVDVAELRLRYEEVLEQLEGVRELNDLLVEDIIAELDQIEDQERKVLAAGTRRLSPAGIRDEVVSKTDFGREVIRAHHELNRRRRMGQ